MVAGMDDADPSDTSESEDDAGDLQLLDLRDSVQLLQDDLQENSAEYHQLRLMVDRLFMSWAASTAVFPHLLRLPNQKLRSSSSSMHNRAMQASAGLFSCRRDRAFGMRWRGGAQLDMRKRDLKNQETVRLWKKLICLRLTKYELDELCRDLWFKNHENMQQLSELEEDVFPEDMNLEMDDVEQNIRRRHLTMGLIAGSKVKWDADVKVESLLSEVA